MWEERNQGILEKWDDLFSNPSPKASVSDEDSIAGSELDQPEYLQMWRALVAHVTICSNNTKDAPFLLS